MTVDIVLNAFYAIMTSYWDTYIYLNSIEVTALKDFSRLCSFVATILMNILSIV